MWVTHIKRVFSKLPVISQKSSFVVFPQTVIPYQAAAVSLYIYDLKFHWSSWPVLGSDLSPIQQLRTNCEPDHQEKQSLWIPLYKLLNRNIDYCNFEYQIRCLGTYMEWKGNTGEDASRTADMFLTVAYMTFRGSKRNRYHLQSADIQCVLAILKI